MIFSRRKATGGKHRVASQKPQKGMQDSALPTVTTETAPPANLGVELSHLLEEAVTGVRLRKEEELLGLLEERQASLIQIELLTKDADRLTIEAEGLEETFTELKYEGHMKFALESDDDPEEKKPEFLDQDSSFAEVRRKFTRTVSALAGIESLRARRVEAHEELLKRLQNALKKERLLSRLLKEGIKSESALLRSRENYATSDGEKEEVAPSTLEELEALISEAETEATGNTLLENHDSLFHLD